LVTGQSCGAAFEKAIWRAEINQLKLLASVPIIVITRSIHSIIESLF
jgi:hypothetical protein